MGDDPRNSSYIKPFFSQENFIKGLKMLPMLPVELSLPAIKLVTYPTLGPLYLAAKQGIKMRNISVEKKRLWNLLLEKLKEFGEKITEYEKYRDAALINIKTARKAKDNELKEEVRRELIKKATETKGKLSIIYKNLKKELDINKELKDNEELKKRFEYFISLLNKEMNELESPENERTIYLPTETESNLRPASAAARPASAVARLGKVFGFKPQDEKQDENIEEYLKNYKLIQELKKEKHVKLETQRDSLMADRIHITPYELITNINNYYDPKIEALKVANDKLKLTDKSKAIIETKLLEEGRRISAGAKVSKAKVPKAKVSKAKVPKAKVSKAKVSKAKVPKAKVPKAKVPKAKVPKAKVPKAKVPKKKVPKAKVPKKKVPKAKPTQTTCA
jgi:hypothetical protein